MPGSEGLAVYAINLDRSQDRWETLKAAFEPLPWPLIRVSACDAREDPQGTLAVRGQSLLAPPNGVGPNLLRARMFTLGEEACFASHMVTLRKFLETNASVAMVVEDDAIPDPQLAAVVEAVLAKGLKFEILKLEGIAASGSRAALDVMPVPGGRVVKSFKPSSGSAGYLVTRAGARKLLGRSGTLAAPYDDYLNNIGLHGAQVLHVAPWLIQQAQLPSLIGTAASRKVKTGGTRFMRRPRLRLRLWLDALAQAPRYGFRFVQAPWAR